LTVMPSMIAVAADAPEATKTVAAAAATLRKILFTAFTPKLSLRR
jgi:hypothetical protein